VRFCRRFNQFEIVDRFENPGEHNDDNKDDYEGGHSSILKRNIKNACNLLQHQQPNNPHDGQQRKSANGNEFANIVVISD
jgi:hypothetical protein